MLKRKENKLHTIDQFMIHQYWVLIWGWSNLANSFHCIFDQLLSDFWYLCLTFFYAASLDEAFVCLSRNVHQLEFERFHYVFDFLRLFLGACDKLIDVADVLLETLVNSASELVIDEGFNFSQKIAIFLHYAFHNFVDSWVHVQKLWRFVIEILYIIIVNLSST